MTGNYYEYDRDSVTLETGGVRFKIVDVGTITPRRIEVMLEAYIPQFEVKCTLTLDKHHRCTAGTCRRFAPKDIQLCKRHRP